MPSIPSTSFASPSYFSNSMSRQSGVQANLHHTSNVAHLAPPVIQDAPASAAQAADKLWADHAKPMFGDSFSELVSEAKSKSEFSQTAKELLNTAVEIGLIENVENKKTELGCKLANVAATLLDKKVDATVWSGGSKEYKLLIGIKKQVDNSAPRGLKRNEFCASVLKTLAPDIDSGLVKSLQQRFEGQLTTESAQALTQHSGASNVARQVYEELLINQAGQSGPGSVWLFTDLALKYLDLQRATAAPTSPPDAERLANAAPSPLADLLRACNGGGIGSGNGNGNGNGNGILTNVGNTTISGMEKLVELGASYGKQIADLEHKLELAETKGNGSRDLNSAADVSKVVNDLTQEKPITPPPTSPNLENLKIFTQPQIIDHIPEPEPKPEQLKDTTKLEDKVVKPVVDDPSLNIKPQISDATIDLEDRKAAPKLGDQDLKPKADDQKVRFKTQLQIDIPGPADKEVTPQAKVVVAPAVTPLGKIDKKALDKLLTIHPQKLNQFIPPNFGGRTSSQNTAQEDQLIANLMNCLDNKPVLNNFVGSLKKDVAKETPVISELVDDPRLMKIFEHYPDFEAAFYKKWESFGGTLETRQVIQSRMSKPSVNLTNGTNVYSGFRTATDLAG